MNGPAFDGAVVNGLVRAVIMEFAVIHASGFLAWPWVARWDRRRRAMFVPALAAAYTVPLAIWALLAGSAWPLAVFWGLMANRMLTVVLGDLPDDAAMTAWGHAWAGTTTLYVAAVLLALTGGAPSEGRVLFIGFAYWTAVGLSGLTDWRWVYRWMAWSRARGRNRPRR